jgi:hypothetical protein
MPKIINNLNPKYTFDEAKQFFALTAKDNPKDLVEIELGDSKDATKFQPQQKISRWNNEVNCSIRLKDFDGFSVETETDKIKLITPEKEVHLYQVEDGEGASEFEIVLNEKPKSNVMEFSIQDKDVDYFFQPELTQKEIDEGASRPDNVTNSYAIYAKTPKTNWEGGKLYRTGKVGHIFRPKIIDAVGTEVWGELLIKDGILSVTIPQDFLDKAVYPIRHAAGLTFGYEGAGATSNNWTMSFQNPGITVATKYTGAAGTATKISASINKTTSTAGGKAGIYSYTDVNNGTLITNGGSGEITIGTTKAWHDFTFGTNPTVAAVNYWLSVACARGAATGSFYLYDDAGDANQQKNDENNYLGATIVLAYPASKKSSIYATYTASASGPANLKTYNTNPIANIKSINTNLIANCKSLNTNV